ncbi:lactonase family protein [Allofustis seminis]|uniref:lactonase family protein n=1 Tax=Allofustis seminis TaxID=166939 RepID=UPI00036FF13E|nr:lactonase family protein [Allofustis seminis]
MEEFALIGTYTRNTSEGLYQVMLDTTTGLLSDRYLVAEIGSPTYLTKDDIHQIIYAIVNENNHGGIVALAENKGHWERVSESVTPGASPCYVAFDKERMLVYTANYHKGTVDVYRTNIKGQLTHLQTIQHKGSSIHTNQQAPHAHYVDLSIDRQYVLACDLGTDEIYTYQINDTDQPLEVLHVFKTPAGFGPRHLLFHPNGHVAYVFGELSSEIMVLTYQAESGTFKAVQTISTLPAGVEHTEGGAALRITHDGRFLYASNRADHTLAIFSVEDDGRLTLSQHIKSGGQTPRDFNLDPSQQWLIVAHQDSGHLTVFERDDKTGHLRQVPQSFFVPEGVCVCF